MSNFNPTQLDTIQTLFANRLPISSTSTGYKYVLRKNIAYNCQYLEYLNNEIENSDSCHIVIQKLHYKMFVVVCFAVIEGILYHALRELNLIKKEEYREKHQFSNDKNNLRVKTYIYEKLDNSEQKEEFLKSKDILKRAQDNNLLGADSKIYSILNSMRQYRDKVHLHISTNSSGTDYNSFDHSLFVRQKEAFKEVLKIYFSIPEDNFCLKI